MSLEIIDLCDKLPPTSINISTRYGHSGTIVGTFLYIYGGLDTASRSIFYNEIIKFDLKSNEWVKCIGSDGKVKGRHFHSCVWNNGDVIYIFGGKCNGYLNDFVEFNVVNEEWKVISNGEKSENYPTKRYGHSGICYNNKMFIFGGYDSNGFDKNDLFCYDFKTRIWIKVKTILPRRFLHCSVMKDNCWFILNGLNSKNKSLFDVWKINLDKYHDDFEEIKIKKNLFKKNPISKKQKNYGQSCFFIDQSLYCYGRRDEKQSLLSLDIENGIWKKVDFPFRDDSFYSYGTINIYDNKLYFYGGLIVRKCHFDLLPDDCIREIFSHLDIDDLMRISLVSKSLSIISNSNYFWDKIFSKWEKKLPISDQIKKKLNQMKNSKEKLALLFRPVSQNYNIQERNFMKFIVKNFDINPNDIHINHSFDMKGIIGSKECVPVIQRYNGDEMHSMTHAKCVVIGRLCNSDKSDVLRNNKFLVPAIEYYQYSRIVKKDEIFNISIHDTIAQTQECYDRLIVPLSVTESDCVIICYSLIDEYSFEYVSKYVQMVKQHAPPNTPIIIAGTKSDLKYKHPKVSKEIEINIMRLIEETPECLFFLESSVDDDYNITTILECAVVAILIQYDSFVENHQQLLSLDKKGLCTIQ